MADKDNKNLNREELFVLKRLVWHDILRRKDIEELLGIGSDYASRIISKVRSLVRNESKGKGYVFDDTSIPDEASASVFLEDLRRSVVEGTPVANVAGTEIPVFVTASPDQHVDSMVLRDIVQAIREKCGLGIAYASMRGGEGIRHRTIDPVALVFVNDRWHVHAYARPILAEDGTTVMKEGGWRDFVLSRIERSHGLMGGSDVRLRDSDQAKMETRRLVPHPDLTEDQRKVVASAWDMDDGELTVEMPATQWFYFKKRYVAENGELPPEKLLVEYFETC